MRERIRNFVFAFIVAMFGVGFLGMSTFAEDPICNDANINQELKDAAGCSEKGTIKKPVANVVNLLLYLVGVVTIVMIIVSAIKMTTSAGNPGAVQKAKMTLLYAIIGLVIAILAYAIINFVLDFTTKQ